MKLSKEFIARFREEARRARWEINSWNGKGIDDLVVDYLERKEFKPEDFVGGCCQNGKDHSLRAIVDQALKDKSAWIGKTVQELTCEAIKKQVEATNTQDEIIRIKCEIEQLKAEQELDNWLKQQFLKRMEDKDE